MTRPATRPEITPEDYPWVHWRRVSAYLNRTWDVENNPHHSIIAGTGAGKTFLVRHGLLPLAQRDRVLIIDTKGDDPILAGTGKPVKQFPRRPWWQGIGRSQDRPRDHWYRLVVDDNTEVGHRQITEALATAYAEGNWIIYLDETWDITNPRKGVGYGCEAELSRIWRKGRGRHVAVIAATQTPVAVPRLFFDQASYAWVGRIRDEDRQKRLLEIGGMSKRDLPVVSTLKRRQWLMAADQGEHFARTVVRK